MNKKFRILVLTLILSFSCSNNPIEIDEALEVMDVTIEGKTLSSVQHVFYNYVYPDQDATRTYTSNYTFTNNKINQASLSLFHYFYDDTSRNYNNSQTLDYLYDINNNLIEVTESFYTEDVLEYTLTNVFEYDLDNRLFNITTKNNGAVTVKEYFFTYNQNKIAEEINEYVDNIKISYTSTFYLDDQNRIYRKTNKGPIFENTNIADLEETSQEVVFKGENVYQVLFNNSPNNQYSYSNKKIPASLPSFNVPFFGNTSYNILLSQFDQITESYNKNYISNIKSLNPTNDFSIIYNNTISKDDYPIKIETNYKGGVLDSKIRATTIYTYE